MTNTKPTRPTAPSGTLKAVSFSRPADQSLAAYKAWMLRVLSRLGGTDDTTEAEWEASWREFWADAPMEVQP